MFHPMRRLARVFGLDHRLWRSANRSSRRRRTSNPFSQVVAEVSLLEERCMMASGWWATDAVGFEPQGGGGLITIKKSTDNPYEAIVGKNGISVEQDQTYTLNFKLSSVQGGDAKGFTVTWVLQQKDKPYKQYFKKEYQIPATGSGLQTVDIPVPASNADASLQLWLGGPGGAWAAKDHAVQLSDFSFSEASNSKNLIPNGYFFTKGNQIEVSSTVGGPGTPVRIDAVNWTGFQKTDESPDGLWGGARTYTSMLDQIKALGFNTIRLPLSSAILDGQPAKNIDFENGTNQELKGLSGLQVLQKVVAYAGQIGLKVILDQHQQAPQEGKDFNPPYYDPRNKEEVWYDKGTKYTPQAWVSLWTTLATDFKDSPAIIGVDLHNEPHGVATTWGGGNKNPNEPTDWLAAAQQGGNAVLSIDPNWLVFVEGVENYGSTSEGWGINLAGVKTAPVVLNVPNRVVYSPHAYDFALPSQNFKLDASLINNAWGYIYQDNLAPVFVGEFALSKADAPKNVAWYKDFVNYLATTTGNSPQPGDQGISWGYFGFTPNSGDTQGVLTDNYKDPNSKVVDELKKIET